MFNRDLSFTSLLQKDWKYFLKSDTIPDTRKAFPKVRSAGSILSTPHFSGGIPLLGGKICIFKSCRKQFQNAYLIQNFPLNNFALRDQFSIPEGSRDLGVPNLTICTTALEYTANSTTIDPYISQPNRNMESIMASKTIQSEISNRIVVLIVFIRDRKINVLPPREENHWNGLGKFVSRARTLRIAFLVPGMVSKFKNTVNPFGQEMWMRGLWAHWLWV